MLDLTMQLIDLVAAAVAAAIALLDLHWTLGWMLREKESRWTQGQSQVQIGHEDEDVGEGEADALDEVDDEQHEEEHDT